MNTPAGSMPCGDQETLQITSAFLGAVPLCANTVLWGNVRALMTAVAWSGDATLIVLRL